VRAAVYRGRGDIRIEEAAEPVPLSDELLIRVTAIGICGTDGHEYAHGPFQFAVPSRSGWGPAGALIHGHEFSASWSGPAASEPSWSSPWPSRAPECP
jgi:(R,R)-butanediol dehydrogenase/meso-butanediol dehydrogenase/diacetyl reductase